MKSIETVTDGIGKYFDQMIDRRNAMRGYFARNVYRQYQKAQQSRWMTENASETGKWKALSTKYKERKPRQFANYPGKGSKMMIATNRLVNSVIGNNKSGEHNVIVTNTGIEIYTSVPYAPFAAEARPFMIFSDRFWREVQEGIVDFLVDGIIR